MNEFDEASETHCLLFSAGPGSESPSLISSSPPPFERRIYEGQSSGVLCDGINTKGRLVFCNIASNMGSGVLISGGANPMIKDCRICYNGLSAVEDAGYPAYKCV